MPDSSRVETEFPATMRTGACGFWEARSAARLRGKSLELGMTILL
jgi:hypothetical protein